MKKLGLILVSASLLAGCSSPAPSPAPAPNTSSARDSTSTSTEVPATPPREPLPEAPATTDVPLDVPTEILMEPKQDPTTDLATTNVMPSLPTLTSEEKDILQGNLRAVDPAATEGSFDKAQAVCVQLANGANDDNFLRGVAMSFGVANLSKGRDLVDAIQASGVCG